MPLVNGYKVLHALKDRQLIGGAFNATNLETTLGILEAIEKSGIPGFIQMTPSHLAFTDFDYLADIVRRYSKNIKTPVALHLDHGRNFDDVKMAIDAGFTSVMLDGSELDFEENIRVTKDSADYARLFDIPLEAELGAISGRVDAVSLEEAFHTDAYQVREFVERSGCSSLAVSVGNVHGLNDKAELDFALLEQIHQESPVPLVIHGASGLEDEEINRMSYHGVSKINIASDLRKEYIKTIGEIYKNNPQSYAITETAIAATESVKNITYHKLMRMNGLGG